MGKSRMRAIHHLQIDEKKEDDISDIKYADDEKQRGQGRVVKAPQRACRRLRNPRELRIAANEDSRERESCDTTSVLP